MSFSGKNKLVVSAILVIILLISGLSAWRAPIIFGLEAAGQAAWLGAWLAATVIFALFWAAVLSAAGRVLQKSGQAAEQTGRAQRLLLALLGGFICGLVGYLLASPAGLSRVTLELYADNVWSPQMFTTTWVKDGLWEIPFALPRNESTPVTLEILAGDSAQAVASTSAPSNLATQEIWLVKASWPDGRDLPFSEFQAEAGWQQKRITWGKYQNQLVWVAKNHQPAVLRWQGQAPGPLTLLFASNYQAGKIILRWQGTDQAVDLKSNTVAFKAVTLPAREPAIWRARLPLSALEAKEIGLTMTPDPAGYYSAFIQKLRFVGLPGPPLEFAQADLPNILQVKDGRLVEPPHGIQIVARDPRDPPQVFITPAKLALVKATSGQSWLDWGGVIPPLENSLLVLYLAAVGFMALGSLARRSPPNFLANLNLLMISLLLAVLLGEVGLKLYLPPAGKYYVWPPNLRQVFRPDPAVFPGITGESRFIVNSQGMRGDEFSVQDDYRILAIGGSTTECLYLDQTEAWPQLLQDKLNQDAQGLQVWVGNVGKSARNTREHILQMKYLLPQYPDIDTVIVLAGFNDLNSSFRWEDSNPYLQTSPGSQQVLLKRAFDVLVEQNPFARYYEQTATWRLLNRIRQTNTLAVAADEIDVEDETGQNYISRRQKRQAGPFRHELPDLTERLVEYSDNLNQIVDLAAANGVRLIFVTQPTMYRPDLTQAEENLFWGGAGPGREYFYTSQAMIDGMARYNQRMLEICQQRGVECIDLAATLPKDTTVFYDEVHFNENGSRLVSDVIASYLLSQPPFSQDQP